MIELEIKSVTSPDAHEPWGVEDGVCLLLDVEIGEKGDTRCDVFSVVVATPDGLWRLRGPDSELISDRATLVFARFDWPLVHRELQRIVKLCSKDEWGDSVLALQRYFQWEYEDMS